MDKSLSKWAGRLLILVASLLLAVALMLAAALAVLDEDDYGDFLVWAAEQYLDVTVTIDGGLSIEPGMTLGLHAQALRLQTHDRRITASITDLGAQLRLRPLLSETVWLEGLTIVGARFDISPPPDSQDDRPGDGARGLPTLILEEARLLDVALAYQDADNNVQKVHIDKLLIDDALDQGPITVGGRGEVNGQHLELVGTLGSREQLMDSATPFPLDLELNSGALSLALAGTIADPIEGRGVDLHVRAEDPDLAASLSLLGLQAPPLGALNIEATVGGDYGALRLGDMALSLRRSDRLDIEVEGGIANVQALTGVDLDVRGAIDDAEVLQWLTMGRLPGFERGRFRGSLSDQTESLQISDLEIDTESETGLKLVLKGGASIDPAITPLTEPDIDLALSLSAPSHSALAALVDHGLPELGPIRLATRVYGRLPLLTFEALDTTVGNEGEHRYVLENGHGQLDLRKDPVLQRATVPMTLTTPRPAGLSRLFGIDLPEFGRTEAQGTWIVDGATVKLEKLSSTTELVGGSTHRLAGSIVHQPGQGSTADIRFDLDTDQVLALWVDNTPGELGRVTGTVDLLRRKDTWQFRRFRLESAQTDLFMLNVAGEERTRKINGPQEMAIRLQIEKPERLLVAAGFDPLPLAPISADATLTAHQGQYRYRGSTVVGQTASQSNLSATFKGGRPVVSGEMTVPLLQLADFGLSVEGADALNAAKTEEAPKAEAQEGAQSKTLFSRKPLELAWLKKLDLDISVQVDELRGVDLEIDEARGRITLQSGLLRLNRTGFRYLGGTASGDYEIDARAQPSFKVDVRVDDLALGDILAELYPDTIKGGILDLELKLEGRGKTAHQVASSLDGSMDAAFEKSRIPSVYIELLSADILGWTLGRTALANGYSHIDCGLVGIDIESGIAQTHALLAEGPDLGISGNANVNLGAETLDMVIIPEQKKTVFTDATPVKLSGSLLDPDVEAIPARAAAKRIGKMALLPQVFVPLEALTQGWRLLSGGGNSSPGCTQVLGRSVAEGFAFEGAQPQAPN